MDQKQLGDLALLCLVILLSGLFSFLSWLGEDPAIHAPP
jgi:hypothetical protein